MVTAIGGGGHGDQILKALRLADARRYHLVGADMNPYCAQFDLCHARVVLPPAFSPAYMDTLMEACRAHSIRALFHGCEPELKMFSRNRERIRAADILLPINAAETIDTCMDKEATMRFLGTKGFDPPKFWVARQLSELEMVDVFPVVLKPSVGSGGSANVHIAQTPEELQLLGRLLRLEEATNSFLIQEYVGTPEDEFTVGVLHDLDGNFINSIALRRELKGTLNIRLKEANRTGRRDLGPNLVVSSGISQGEIGSFPSITRQCEEIAAAIGARGTINIQCRVVGGKVKVFEINPRFSGTTSIRAMMGYNEPDILIRKHLLGDLITPRFHYRSGIIIRTLTEQILPGPKG